MNFLLLGLAGLFAAQAAAASDSLVIQNVSIVSPELAVAVPGQAVRIIDGRIVEIGASPLIVSEGEAVLEGKGRYLAPGLTDSHHHVSFVPGMGAAGLPPASEYPELVAVYLAQQPRSLLYHGVTQVLDPAPLTGWEAFTDQPQHPDLLRCGEIPGPHDGYPLNQREGERAHAVYPYAVDTAAEAASVIARIQADGAVCVKIYLEDGFGAASEWPLMSDGTLDAIVAEAEARSMPVLVHANAIDMYQIALDHGVGVMAHGLWNWQWPDGEPPVVETLDRVIESGAGYMPTLRVMAGLADHVRPGALDNPDLAPVTPAPLMAFYRAGGADWFADELASDFPAEMPRDEIADIFGFGVQRGHQALGYVHGQDHPIMLASDCPGSPTAVNQPGLCTLYEMEAMAEAGMSPADILRSGTLTIAEQFGVDSTYGRVATGFAANLVLLNDNPLEDVAAWQEIEFVILHGAVIERSSLRAR
ncbi:amidohydrolase [Wenzhouxiangella sediminis]|uniref:Amidohydrolase n=1 Tax=Wenzhouxiangella sediminis TaxID=1792836 RepID=A0A3E1K9V7_9GAMM|nr:amidohydrolase [Wenzhouxiangella sediminis]